MSDASRARTRQAVTGERYVVALCHERRECGRCKNGKKCDTCKKEPCFFCRPECKASHGLGYLASRCAYDDLMPDGSKKCGKCGQPQEREP